MVTFQFFLKSRDLIVLDNVSPNTAFKNQLLLGSAEFKEFFRVKEKESENYEDTEDEF